MPAKGTQTGTYINCQQCGKPVYSYPSRPRQFCSKACHRTFKNLTNENPSHHRDISGKNNPMYGKGLSGEDNGMYGRTKEQSPRWAGGRKARPDGYVRVIAPDDHPYPSEVRPSGTKYILEHRLVIEQHLGRYLEPHEVVHHVDGDTSNNDIDNLRLHESQSDHVRIEHGS